MSKIYLLDSKQRITVPARHIALFESRVVHFSLITQGLLASNTPYEGLGVYSEAIDSGNRVMIGSDILDIINIGTLTTEEDRGVIWLPNMNPQRKVEFILLFGKEGRRTLDQILLTKRSAIGLSEPN